MLQGFVLGTGRIRLLSDQDAWVVLFRTDPVLLRMFPGQAAIEQSASRYVGHEV